MKKIGIYTRVSTHAQSPESQLLALRNYTKQRGWAILREFSDIGVSGTVEKRPELSKLMECARKRQIDVVLVFRFDRFARSTSHLIQSLELFKSLGIDFVSYQENIDTGSPLGSAIFTIVAAVSQLEKDILKERVNAGIEKARQAGKTLGRPRAIIDMDVVKDLREKGMSLRDISKELGVSKDTISRFLKLYQKLPQDKLLEINANSSI